MKRIAMFAVLLGLGIPATAQAQSFELIAQLGVSLGSYSGDNIESSTQVGADGGVKVRFGSAFYVDGGIFWGARGGELNDGTNVDDFAYSGVRIPMGVGVRLIRADAFDIRAFAAASLDLPSSVSDNGLDLVDEDVSSSIWSGRVGAGIDFLIIGIDAGYEFGLSDVFADTAPAELAGVKRNAWFLEAGLRFGF